MDKRISELAASTGIQATDLGVLVDSNVDYKWTFAQLLTFLSTNLTIGALVSFGTSIPANTVGNNGDIFVKTDTQQFAQKASGTWSVVYTVSATGQLDGTVLYGTSTPPNNSLGNNNDTYINTLTGVFYQKTAGAWAQVFSMASGPAGPRGNSILNGVVNPINSTGVNGDFYLNTVTETIFGPKASGVWPGSGTVLKGANGNTILSGTSNPINGNGNNGDFYLNTATYYLFGPKASGVWPAGVSIIGGAPDPLVLDFAQGSPNPLFVSYTSYASTYGPIPTVLVLIRNLTAISSFGALSGSGFDDGTWIVNMTGGTGAGCITSVVVAGGIIQSVDIVYGGRGYLSTDILTGNFGSGDFTLHVQSVGNNYALAQISPEYAMNLANSTVNSFIINDPDIADGTITADEIRLVIKQ